MFAENPITSIEFDVSNLSDCRAMFVNCGSLTSCTSAKFKQGASCQSMFSGCNFDAESAELIFNAGFKVVSGIHVGISSDALEPLKNKIPLIKYNDANDKQWCYGTSVSDKDATFIFVVN